MTVENMPNFPHPNADIYDAVDAEISGGAFVEAINQGYNGKGYVGGYLDTATASTMFTVEATIPGDYFISLRYAAGAASNWNTDRTVGLSVNGGDTIKVPFKSISARWDVWSENVQKVNLKAGTNTISYQSITENDNSDCINIDQLSVWKFDDHPTTDGIVFNASDYSVSEKYVVETAIQEVDTNGIRIESTSEVEYHSQDPSVATVDSVTGVVTGIKEGTTIISAHSLGYTVETVIHVLKNPTIEVDCKNAKSPVDPSTFGYILTPNYDVPDSRMTLLGPILNRETLPVQNFQAIGDLDGSYYTYEDSVLQRCLEAYKRAKSAGLKWYMLLGLNPSWASSNGAPLETFENKQTKSDIEQERFKQYIKDALQYFKDNGATPDFTNLTNEYWTGTERTFKGNWEAVREVYPDFIPVVGPGGVGFSGIPDYYIPFASENNITIEGPGWHEYWVNDRYASFSQMEQWKGVIADYQEKYPEVNGKYIIFEENNAGSKHPADWTRSMANVIRAGVNKMIKGCLEARNANGMSDLLTTNVLEENPAARRSLWWVYYMFSQMTGHYADISTDITEDFTAVSSTDSDETKVIFAKNNSDGLVTIMLKNQPYKGEEIVVDLYKIIYSENNGLAYQYSMDAMATEDLELTLENIEANDVWMAVIKKVKSMPSFFFPIAPDDGETANVRPTFSWSTAQGANGYNIAVSTNKDLSNPIINETNIIETSYTAQIDLSIGQTYYWSVTAVNEYGHTKFYNDTVYSILVQSNPNVPGQFGPYMPSVNAPNESVTPEFKWSVAYNATSYRVVVSKEEDLSNPVIDEANITTVRDTGMYGPKSQGYYQPEEPLAYDTTYYWVAYAENAVGELLMNGPLHYFTTKSEGDAPKAFSLMFPEDGEKDVTARTVLSWENSKNAFFYKLEISVHSDMSNPVILRDRMIHNRYTVEPNVLEPGKTYYWRVSSYTKDLVHEQHASNGEIRSFTVELVPCSPLLYAEQAMNRKVKLHFQQSIGATSYKIKYGTSPGNYTSSIGDVKGSPYEVASLTNDMGYYFAVVAVNEHGESSIWNERNVTPNSNDK